MTGRRFRTGSSPRQFAASVHPDAFLDALSSRSRSGGGTVGSRLSAVPGLGFHFPRPRTRRFAETRRPVTWYRQHEHSLSSNATASWRGTLLGVERYFERHPEQRRTHLERQVASMLDLLAAELQQSGPIWRSRHFWRALAETQRPCALSTCARSSLGFHASGC